MLASWYSVQPASSITSDVMSLAIDAGLRARMQLLGKTDLLTRVSDCEGLDRVLPSIASARRPAYDGVCNAC